jgi:hypothetical protein
LYLTQPKQRGRKGNLSSSTGTRERNGLVNWLGGKHMFSVYTSIFWPSRTTAVSVVTKDSSAGFCASFSTVKFSQSFRVKPTKIQ